MYLYVSVRVFIPQNEQRSRDGKPRVEKGAGAIHEAQSVDVCIGDVPVAAIG